MYRLGSFANSKCLLNCKSAFFSRGASLKMIVCHRLSSKFQNFVSSITCSFDITGPLGTVSITQWISTPSWQSASFLNKCCNFKKVFGLVNISQYQQGLGYLSITSQAQWAHYTNSLLFEHKKGQKRKKRKLSVSAKKFSCTNDWAFSPRVCSKELSGFHTEVGLLLNEKEMSLECYCVSLWKPMVARLVRASLGLVHEGGYR